MLEPCPAADFELNGRTYAVLRMTNRERSLTDWFMEQVCAPLLEPEETAAGAPLDRPTFEAAVRQALRDFHRPERLADNPLMRSRLVTRASGSGSPLAAVEGLLRLLREGCEAQQEGDPTDVGYAVLKRNFLGTRSKQIMASIDLNLPYSTYRRHLALAIRRLTDWLWLRETSAEAGSSMSPSTAR